MNLVNTDLPRFCPRENCSHYQDTDNLISKAGTCTTKNDPVPRQRYWCHGGEHKFSESFIESPFTGLPQKGTVQKTLPSMHTWNENGTHNRTG
jgi:hypothetical protein